MEKYSGLQKTWDAWIVGCATLSALLLPVVLVFNHGDKAGFVLLEWGFTLLYSLDLIFLYLRQQKGGVRTCSVSRLLLVDFLAAIPFFLMPTAQLFLLFRLFKLFRVFRHMQEWKRHHARSANVLRLAFLFTGFF